jgi:hypothetical protein
LYWFSEASFSINSSLHKRLWEKQTQVRRFFGQSPKPLIIHRWRGLISLPCCRHTPFQSGITLLFSKCYSPLASGTSHICIFIRSVCTVLNPTIHRAPHSHSPLWMLIPFLWLEPLSQGHWRWLSPVLPGTFTVLNRARAVAFFSVSCCDPVYSGSRSKTHVQGTQAESKSWELLQDWVGSNTNPNVSCFQVLSLHAKNEDENPLECCFDPWDYTRPTSLSIMKNNNLVLYVFLFIILKNQLKRDGADVVLTILSNRGKTDRHHFLHMTASCLYHFSWIIRYHFVNDMSISQCTLSWVTSPHAPAQTSRVTVSCLKQELFGMAHDTITTAITTHSTLRLPQCSLGDPG